MSQNKKYIVITGQIASGKSTLSNFIEKKYPEFLVLDADSQVKELYKRGAGLYDVIVKTFGNSVLNEKGNISKSKLRDVAFLNEKNRKKLNSVTHDTILKNMIEISKNSNAKVVFLQIPLLSECISKLRKLIKISEVWNIVSNDEIRFERLLSRKGMTPEIASKIMEVQSNFDSDDYDILTIENNGSIEEFENSVPIIFSNSIANSFVENHIDLLDEKEIEDTGLAENMAENTKEDFKIEFAQETLNKENVESINDLRTTEEELEKFFAQKELEITTKNDVLNDYNFDEVESKNKETLSVFIENGYNEEQEVNDFEKKVKSSLNLNDTTVISSIKEENSNIKSNSYVNIKDDNLKSNLEEGEAEVPTKKKKKEKKKRSIFKRILFGIFAIFILLNAIFFGAIAYGGKNYPLEYIEEINKYATEYGVDPRVVLAITRVESNFTPNAESKANAKGLMQILPDTSKHISKLLKIDESKVDLMDSETNIQFGTYYIKYLMENFKNLDTVYAAYNGGIGNVNTWLKDEKYSNDGVSLYNIPASETKHYVYKVNKALKAYEILYGKEFPTKKETGFKRFLTNAKNVIKYIFNSY